MKNLLAILSTLLLASGCATTGGNSNPADPWEGLNRATYGFNDALDKAVLKPVAQGYEKVVPQFARAGVTNFFENIGDVDTGINNLLQGKFAQGGSDLGRFAFNSVFGIFGLWDVATPLGLEKHYEDFGQTLGWWGMPPGPYLVIPLFGPSTLRDAPAKYVDSYAGYYPYVDDIAVRNSLFGIGIVSTRANLLQSEKILDEAALDKYSFVRDAWLQRRRSQVYDGSPPREKEE
jgi:phospholipid-binding lipoprotein MlaA